MTKRVLRSGIAAAFMLGTCCVFPSFADSLPGGPRTERFPAPVQPFVVQLPREFSAGDPLAALLIAAPGADGAVLKVLPPPVQDPAYLQLPLLELPANPSFRPQFYSLLQRLSSGRVRVSPLHRLLPEPSTERTDATCLVPVSSVWREVMEALPEDQLEQLINVRLQKRELLEQRLRRQLDPAHSAALQEMEASFGFRHTELLNNGLPLASLLSRLSLARARGMSTAVPATAQGDTPVDLHARPAGGDPSRHPMQILDSVSFAQKGR